MHHAELEKHHDQAELCRGWLFGLEVCTAALPQPVSEAAMDEGKG